MEVNDLYRDIILKHARNPQNEGALEEPDLKAAATNKLCGDELELTLNMDAAQIADAKIKVRGCAVVQASSSLMSEMIKGANLKDACAQGAQLKACLEGEAEPDEKLESLLPLLTLKSYKARHRCVMLPWEALDLCSQQKDAE